MTYLPPSSEQVYLIGSRAQTWFMNIYKHICTDARIPMTIVLQNLIGCWICEKALMRYVGKPDIYSIAGKIQKHLDIKGREAFSELLNSDAALVLLSAGILRALDSKSETIELFIQEVAAGLNGHEDRDKTETTELFATRFLLHKLHLHQDLCTYSINWPQISSEKNLFQADESVIRALASDIAAATSFGQRFPSVEPALLKQLAIVLPVWTLFYLRQYNLEMGTLLLRTMNYLHLREDIAFQECLNFVLAQQQLDGCFGFLAPEVSRLQSNKSDFNDAFELYLPLTVSCLWAIAEATNPDFILFSSI